jgi:hypothetical protein
MELHVEDTEVLEGPVTQSGLDDYKMGVDQMATNPWLFSYHAAQETEGQVARSKAWCTGRTPHPSVKEASSRLQGGFWSHQRRRRLGANSKTWSSPPRALTMPDSSKGPS